MTSIPSEAGILVVIAILLIVLFISGLKGDNDS